MEILSIVTAIMTAIVLSILGYLKSRPDGSFDKEKFFETAIIGAVVGIILAYRGLEVTETNYESIIATYAGIITFVQYIYKSIARDPTIRIAINKLGSKLE